MPSGLLRRAALGPALALLVLAGALGGKALGNWSGANAAGSAAADAATLEAGSLATVAMEGGVVTVAWTESKLSNGLSADGYMIRRYDAETGLQEPIGSGCSGTVSALTCTESELPAGEWAYAVIPVFGSNWRGPEGPMSDPLSIESPVLMLTRSIFGGPTASLPASANGTVSGFEPSAAVEFFLDGGQTPLGGSPSSVDSSGTAPVSITIPSGTPDGHHSLAVRSATREAIAEIVVDSTAPSGGSVVAEGLEEGAGGSFSSTRNLRLVLARGTDSVSGLADGSGSDDLPAELERATAVLGPSGGPGGGECGTFSGFAEVGVDDPVSPIDDSVPANDTCYLYRYLVSDHAGNVAVYTSDEIKVQATAPVLMGQSGSFAVLAASTVTSGGVSHLTGDLGVSPGTAITGFPPGTTTGATYLGGGAADEAQSDSAAAFADAAGRVPTSPAPAALGGQTLTRGVYASPTFTLTGDLTLDGRGDPDAVFIFQAGSTLDTAAASQINLVNGAQACNVFWQVGSSATLGASSTFAGSILAWTSISMGANVELSGRALAHTGAVTLIDATITVQACD